MQKWENDEEKLEGCSTRKKNERVIKALLCLVP
jgi:hypothetical protein